MRYGRNAAVDDVTFNIPRGSVYALLGRNGAGKSSLLRTVLGQRRAEGGQVRLLGEDSWRHRVSLMQRIGVVPEDSDAPPEMSVGALALFSRRIYAQWDQEGFESRMRAFAIPLTARFAALSKGQKKQVSLALAMAMSPELIILDDPTLGLDAIARKTLFDEVIGGMAERGITVFLTTHDLAGVETFADRVGILAHGRMVLEDDVDALRSRFRRIRFAAESPQLESSGLSATAIRRWGSGAEAIVSNYDVLALERYRTISGVSAAEVAVMSLEEIFIAVAGDHEGGRQ